MNKSYISGFFDADGYITSVKPRRNEEPTVTIGFTNTVRGILEEIQSHLKSEIGVKGHISTKKAAKENHNTSYDLKYVGFKSCMILKDYIQSKHPKKAGRFEIIETIIQNTPRNGRYTPEMKQRRNKAVELLISIK